MMSLQEVIVQLESIRANSASFLDPEDSDSIWQKDVEALDEIITILKGMEQESRWKRFLRGIWSQFRQIAGGDCNEAVSGDYFRGSTTRNSG